MQNQVHEKKSTECAVFLSTAPNPEVAAELARGLVTSGLAACVNLIPQIRSFYIWDGSLQDDAETQLVIKGRIAQGDALFQWLKAHHPYDEPEFLELSVTGGSPSYLRWVLERTQQTPG